MPTFDLLRGYRSIWWTFIGMTLVFGSFSVAVAGPTEREQAFRIHNRLAGVPPDEATLMSMDANISSGPAGAIAAAMTAMDNPNFYTVTLRNFAAPWTNRDESVFVPLNDYTTLVIGMVKDNVPFDQILSANMLYRSWGCPSLSSTNEAYTPDTLPRSCPRFETSPIFDITKPLFFWFTAARSNNSFKQRDDGDD